MGYYRSEYEDYYRGVRRQANGSTYIRSNGIQRARSNKGRKSGIGSFFEMIVTQTVGIGIIATCVYVGGFSEKESIKRDCMKIKEIVKTDYYFNEKEVILNFRDKILDNIKSLNN